jgi:hypothetical protein
MRSLLESGQSLSEHREEYHASDLSLRRFASGAILESLSSELLEIGEPYPGVEVRSVGMEDESARHDIVPEKLVTANKLLAQGYDEPHLLAPYLCEKVPTLPAQLEVAAVGIIEFTDPQSGNTFVSLRIGRKENNFLRLERNVTWGAINRYKHARTFTERFLRRGCGLQVVCVMKDLGEDVDRQKIVGKINSSVERHLSARKVAKIKLSPSIVLPAGVQ